MTTCYHCQRDYPEDRIAHFPSGKDEAGMCRWVLKGVINPGRGNDTSEARRNRNKAMQGYDRKDDR